MNLNIEGRVAVVTGGDSGIGWQTARTLLDEGVRVALCGRDPSSVADAAARLRGDVVGIAADLTKTEDVARLHDEVTQRLGAAQILVHAAGVTGATGRFHEIDEKGWRDTWEVDFFATVKVVRAFIGDLCAGGWGRIVLLASEDAVQPYPDELPYCAAKAAVLNLAKGLSKSYADDGVLVNAVSPAFIATPMTDAMMNKRAEELGVDFDEAVASFLEEERPSIELNRRGRPDEVAAVIAFLCSERAGFVNGSNYRVDAGSVAAI